MAIFAEFWFSLVAVGGEDTLVNLAGGWIQVPTTDRTVHGSTQALAEISVERDQIGCPFVGGLGGVRVRGSYQRSVAVAR